MIRALAFAPMLCVGLTVLAISGCGAEPSPDGPSARTSSSSVAKSSTATPPRSSSAAVARSAATSSSSASASVAVASSSGAGPLDPTPANVDALVGGGPALSGLPVRATDGDKPFDAGLRSRLSRQSR